MLRQVQRTQFAKAVSPPKQHLEGYESNVGSHLTFGAFKEAVM